MPMESKVIGNLGPCVRVTQTQDICPFPEESSVSELHQGSGPTSVPPCPCLPQTLSPRPSLTW